MTDEEINKILEEDGGVKELDSFFEDTPLEFLEYIKNPFKGVIKEVSDLVEKGVKELPKIGKEIKEGFGKGTDKTVKLPNQGEVDAGVQGAPKVDAGKQGKHVLDHPNSMPGKKTQWPEGENGIKLTQEAWMKGTKVKPDGSVRTYDFNKPIGSNGETKVKVHIDKKGNIHGYPVK